MTGVLSKEEREQTGRVPYKDVRDWHDSASKPGNAKVVTDLQKLGRLLLEPSGGAWPY